MRKSGSSLTSRAAVAAGAILLIVLLISQLNPFGEDTIDRTGPAVLKSIENLGELKSATANLQVIVDVERDTNNVPSWLKGERVLFLAAGKVDAVVDLRSLKDGDIKVSHDRRRVTLTLPRAELRPATIDTKRSRVFDRDRGLVDRVGDFVGDGVGRDGEVYDLGRRKLEEAAAGDPQVLLQAEANAKATLIGLLKGLGFEKVDVAFRVPDPPKS